MAFTPAPVRDPFDKDLRASRSWVAWFAEVQQTITNIVAGSVTSVGLALPSQFTVSGSPVTGAGTLTGAWKNQSANAFLGGPITGASAAPDFRALTAADIPALAYDPLGSAATVQTNLNTHTGLTGTAVHGLGNWSVVNYPTWASGTPFVKMTAAGTFTLDTSTYLTSLSGAVLTDQTVGQTIGATGTRLTKLWATDITVTNAITGSVTGNAGTVTNGLYTTGLGSVTQAYSAKLAGLAGLTDAAGWYHSNGSGTYAWSTPSASDVGAAAIGSTLYIGTTGVTLNRSSAALSVADLSVTGSGTWNAGSVISSSTVFAGVTSATPNAYGSTSIEVRDDIALGDYARSALVARNAAGTGTVFIAGLDGSNNLYLGHNNPNLILRAGSSAVLSFSGSAATFAGTITLGTSLVGYGANDSGGTGYKVLRVPN